MQLILLQPFFSEFDKDLNLFGARRVSNEIAIKYA